MYSSWLYQDCVIFFSDGWLSQSASVEGIIMACTEEQEEQYQPIFTVERAVENVPPGVLKLSPLVHLKCQPQHVQFEPQIRLYLPVCSSADSAWRSTERGWEKIEWKSAGPGYALLTLEHFCHVFMGTRAEVASGLTSRLYRAAEGSALKVTFEEQGCHACQERISTCLPSHRLLFEAVSNEHIAFYQHCYCFILFPDCFIDPIL